MRVRTVFAVWALCLSVTAATPAADKEKAKDKNNHEQSVDSGTFGVFMNGQRVGTETFSIQQNNSGSVISSEFRAGQGTQEAAQSSELQLTSSGEIRKYEWKETEPEKLQAVVLPNDNFLIERITTNPTDKPQEQPFLLPASTSILDDYFFVQREVLAWKYLATTCRAGKGQLECPKGQKTMFGTLNPHSRISMSATVEYTGSEKISIRGVEQELGRLELKSEAGDWSLWVNGQFKLMRISAGNATEVVRD